MPLDQITLFAFLTTNGAPHAENMRAAEERLSTVLKSIPLAQESGRTLASTVSIQGHYKVTLHALLIHCPSQKIADQVQREALPQCTDVISGAVPLY